ncbi:MAG: pilus assembly protein [Cypionkella sp.]|jgi:Flp pilus assembly protein TadG|nr:pilus assembly protein [Cypionkella sp.]
MTHKAFRFLPRAFLRKEEGTVTVEFALLFPVVFFMFIWATELGLIMTKQVMMEHAVDMSMRELRLGRMQNPSSDTLKDEICSRAAILTNCRDTLMIELQPVNTATWAMPATPVSCTDREQPLQPVVTFSPGAQNQIMLMRACVLVEPVFPGVGIGAGLEKDPQGGFAMVAASAFVNEP